MNFGFLPVPWLRNFVLSYNLSVTRSQTNIIIGQTVEDTTYTPPSGTPGTPRYKPEKYNYLQNSEPVLVTRNSENQPEVYGNVALGYDIGGFSARVSVYYQGKYTSQYSAFGTSDGIVDEFTKWDLALKQQVTSNIALFLNVNNIFNKEETRSRLNKIYDWGYLPRTAELYGTSVDLAVRILL
jgi:outer membrane receptor protein involved in Fe transport